MLIWSFESNIVVQLWEDREPPFIWARRLFLNWKLVINRKRSVDLSVVFFFWMGRRSSDYQRTINQNNLEKSGRNGTQPWACSLFARIGGMQKKMQYEIRITRLLRCELLHTRYNSTIFISFSYWTDSSSELWLCKTQFLTFQ